MKINWSEYNYKAPILHGMDAIRDLLDIRSMSDDEKKRGAYRAFKDKYTKEWLAARSEQFLNLSNIHFLVQSLNDGNRDEVIAALRTFYGRYGFYPRGETAPGYFDYSLKLEEILNPYNLCEGI